MDVLGPALLMLVCACACGREEGGEGGRGEKVSNRRQDDNGDRQSIIKRHMHAV